MKLSVINYHRAAAACHASLEFFHLASVPSAEDCTPAGADYSLQKIECETYIRQLIRTYGPVPEGASFFIIENLHEFGTYFEAAIWYVPEDEESEEETESESFKYALQCEQGPEYWDQQAKSELIESGYFKYVGAKVIQMRKTA